MKLLTTLLRNFSALASLRRGISCRKVLIIAYLVEECVDYSNEEIEKEVYPELSEEHMRARFGRMKATKMMQNQKSLQNHKSLWAT